DLIGQCMDGVLVDVVYDGWSPARQYAVYHGGLRLLSESASARIASPVDIPFDRLGRGIGYDAKVSKWNFPNPWPGGHWTLGDIMHYQLAAFFSVAHNLAVNREEFLRNYYTVNQHAVERQGTYIVPAAQSDPLATATLINTLREGRVEIGRATAAFEAGGNAYPAGSYLIRLGQPNGAFAKTLLEDQHYPDLRQYPGGPPQRPYDVTAQTLPLLLGVKVTLVEGAVTATASPVTSPVAAPAGQVGDAAAAAGYRLATQGQDALLATYALLRQNAEVQRAGDGTLYVAAGANAGAALAQTARRFAVSATPVATLPSGLRTLHLPRVGLYASWVAQIDEGWTRFIFDQDGIPYTSIHDADLRVGDLRQRFDAILIPDQNPRSLINGNPAGRVPPEYAGGPGTSGMDNLKTFVQQGGTLIALNQASLAFLDWTGGQVKDALAGDRAYYSPGSILQVTSHPDVPAAWGAAPQVAIFSLQSPAFAL
ncbi:MAG: peptidase M14, partial [Terriglobales bacterium]